MGNDITEGYEAWGEQEFACYNPNNVGPETLPVIYGLNNGGDEGFYSGLLLGDNGMALGGHMCSNESWMLIDLGIKVGCRWDRHETFRKYYPDGYRMDFVSAGDVLEHEGLMAAYAKNQEIGDEECAA